MPEARVLVRRNQSLINDFHFRDGPVYIGRRPQCDIFLPDRAVSRQHAVLFTTGNGTWMAQDLESANRTMVNGKPVAKVPLHEGDVISIGDFTIEVHFEKKKVLETESRPLELDDTLVGTRMETESIYQTTRQDKNQVLHLPTQRIRDFYMLNLALFHLSDQETLLHDLCTTLLGQFEAYHVWAGLRETTEGPLTCHGGCNRGGRKIRLEELAGRKIVRQALEDECYVLLPNVAELADPNDSTPAGVEKLRSAMAAPIVGPAGAYGVIYVDNGIDQGAFSHQDLDYLTLVSTQIAAVCERIG